MKKYIIALLYCFLCAAAVSAQDKLSEKNYRIYSVKLAKEVSLNEIAADMENYDVLFFWRGA